MRVSTKLFLFDKSDMTFSQEASSLDGKFNAQKAIILVSSNTGNTMTFELDRVDRDDDNDVRYWAYKLCDRDKRANPNIQSMKVIIFND